MIKKYYYACTAFPAFAVLATLAFTEPGFLPRFFKTLGAAGVAGANAADATVSFFGPVFLAPGLFLDPFGRPRRSELAADFDVPALLKIEAILLVILTFLPLPL